MSQDVKLRLSVSGQAQVVGAMAQVESATGKAAGAWRSLAAAIGAGLSIGAIIEAADSITTLRNRLELATGSARTASQAFDALFKIAQSSRTSFTELGATFASISQAGQSLGLSQQRLLVVTEAIGNAMTISGGSAQSMQDALVQLSQGLSSGTLRGDELNSVIEQTPRLAKALADGMGVSTGELRKLGEAGSITAQQVIQALEKSAPKLAQEVQGATMTVGQAFTVLSNSTTRFVGEADQATGATSALAGAMVKLAGAIDSAGDFIAEHETAFKIIGTALAGAAVVGGVVALGGALSSIGTAVGALGVVLAANPIVLTLLGIGAAAGAVISARDAVGKTAQGMAQEIESLASRIKKAETDLNNVGEKDRYTDLTKDLRARLDAMRARKNQLQQELAAAEAGANSSPAEDARLAASSAQYAAQAAAAKGLAEVKAKLMGLDSDYVGNIEKIIAARQKGLVSDKEYVALLGEMQQAALKATDAADSVGNAIAAQQASAAEAIKRQLNDVQRMRATGVLNERQAIEETTRLEIAALAVRRQGLQAQADASTSDAASARLRQQAGEIDAQILTRRREGENAILELKQRQITAANAIIEAQRQEDDDARRQMWDQDAAAMARVEQSLYDYTLSLREAGRLNDAALSVLGSATVARALAVEQLRTELDLKRRIAEIDATSGPNIDEAWRERQRQRARDAAAIAASNARGSAVADFVGKDMGLEVAEGFDKASQSLAAFVKGFGTLISMQSDYAAARKAAGDDAVKIAAVEEKNARNQLSAYGTLAGAAKSFFSEGSKGYKAMESAEKVFRAFELANAVKNAATQLGLFTSVTAAKVAGDTTVAASATASAATQVAAATAVGQANAVAAVANQGNGDPYSAFFRVAAMAAIMAALGYSTGALGGGSGPTVDKGNTGAGTVFGDKDAQSESVANALELLSEVDTRTMQYSAQMAASLRSIENNIGGLTNLLIRAGAVDAAAAGIDTNAKVTGLGQVEGALARGAAAYVTFGLTEVLGIGKMIEGLAGKLFNAKTSVTGQGIYADPQSLGAIMANGFDASYYADTYTRKKAFGFTYSRSSGTQYTSADAELERQFGLIFEGFNDAVEAAAGPLGAALSDVEQRLTGFVVNIGKINLQGLSGSEIQEKLSAVFGAAGDNIAAAALPGLEQFQQVGEGYLETVVRVASSLEQVNAVLNQLGQTALQASISGAGAALGLADAFGGLDDLVSATQAYYDALYTDAEKLGNSQRTIRDALAGVGLQVPSTVAEYRRLVAAQDLMSESGRRAYSVLVSLGPMFAEVADAWTEAQRAMSSGLASRSPRAAQVVQLQADAEKAATALRETIDKMLEAARGQGAEASAQAWSAAQAMARAAAGGMLLDKPLEGMALEMERVRANAEAMRGELTRLFGGKAQEIIDLAIPRQQELLRRDWFAGITDQILQLTDASAYAAEQLRREQEQRLADAEALGLNADQLAVITKLHQAQTAALKEQSATWKDSAGQQLRNWLNGQALGGTSTLDPGGKLRESQAQFADLLARARGSDQEALSQITGAADALLQAGQAFNGSNGQQAALVQWTRQSLESLGSSLQLAGFTPAEQKEASQRQTEALQQAVVELKAMVRLQGASAEANGQGQAAIVDRLEAVESALKRLAA